MEIVRGNDISISWRISRIINGIKTPESLTTATNLKVVIESNGLGVPTHSVTVTDVNLLTILIKGQDQISGIYSLEASWISANQEDCRVARGKVFTVVDKDCQADYKLPEGIDVVSLEFYSFTHFGALYENLDVVKDEINQTVQGALEGNVLTYDSTLNKWLGRPIKMYDRLDSWGNYELSKSGWILSASLGYDLYTKYLQLIDSDLGGGGSNVSWGAQSNNSIDLTVNGTSKTLSTSTHNHNDKYLSINSNFDNRYLKLTGGTVTGITTFENGIRIGSVVNGGVIIEWDNINKAIKVNGSLFATAGLSAYGYGIDGGGGSSYDLLNTWADYTSEKSGWVLSAFLGNDLNTRLTSLESGVGSVSWTNIIGKPIWVTDTKPVYTWNEINQKPTVFTPDTHYHSISDITNLSTELSGKLTATEFATYFIKENIGTIESPIWAIKAQLGLYTDSFLSAYGLGPDDGGGGVSYDRLDTWNYDSSKSEWVLSAFLGNDLNTRLNTHTHTKADIGLSNVLNVASYSKTEADELFQLKSAVNDLFVKENIGTELSPIWVIKANFDLYSVGGISAYGLGIIGGGCVGTAYERLDTWADYTTEKSGWVLSAFLGNDLNTRLNSHSHVLDDITGLQSELLTINTTLGGKASQADLSAHTGNTVIHVTQTDKDNLALLLSWWKVDVNGNLYTEKNLYSTKEVSAYGAGTGGGGSVMALSQLTDVTFTSVANNDIIKYDSTTGKWLNVPFPTASSVYWDDVLNKPTTFVPASHPHAIADVTNLQATLNGKQAYDLDLDAIANLSGTVGYLRKTAANSWELKNESYSLSGHTHTKSEITDFPSIYTKAEADSLLSAKVDKVTGKSLILDTEITRLAGVTNQTLAGLGGEPAFSKNTGFNKNFGTVAGTVAEGNHTHTSAQIGLGNVLNVASYSKTEADTLLSAKVDKVIGKSLISDSEITRLASVTNQTLSGLGGEPAFSKNTAFNKNFGTTAGTVSEGNHTHTFASLTSKPTTLAGYGITAGLTTNYLTKWNGTTIVNSSIFDNGTNVGIGTTTPTATLDVNGTGKFKDDILMTFNTWSYNNWTYPTDKNSLNKFLKLFDIDTEGNLVVKTNLYSTGEVTAYKSGTGVSGLTLQGDMNANGKNITGASQIYAGNAYMGNVGINPSLQWSYEGDENTMAEYDVLTGEYFYAGKQVKYGYDRLEVVGQVKASEFKFGNYSFKQSANGLSICFNGVEQAYITNTGQYVNS